MGCSCNNNIGEFITSEINKPNIKEKFQKEYFSYMSFIFKLKEHLNNSLFSENNSISNINGSDTTINKDFYLIPLKWFEDWEKWIKDIIMKGDLKNFNGKFKYKNYRNKYKFYFQLLLEENWLTIYKNKMYYFAEDFKIKTGLICNNLIIFQYISSSGEKNAIEIFFFEKDEDLFLTNLLFSFEKCDDPQTECNNFLKILKTSPIFEILGNLYYDLSKSEFFEKKKKIIIYNKTRILSEEIKYFRKKQYKLYLDSIYNKEKDEFEGEKMKLEQKTTAINNNEQNNNCINININIQKNESQAISRASTIMNLNNQSQANNNGHKSRLIKPNDIFSDEMNERDKNDKKNHKKSDKQLINNIKLRDVSKKIINDETEVFNNKMEFEITELIENKINESLLLSILYCLFNINQLREFVFEQKNLQNDENNICKLFYNVMKYLIDKICDSNNSIDIKKIESNSNNLILNCPQYNFKYFEEIIKAETGKNIFIKMINLLHSNFNNKIEDVFRKPNNNFINKYENNTKYKEFVDNTLSIHNSIIFDLFFGIKKVKKICSNCKGELNTYKLINIIDLSIDKIRKQKYKKEVNRQKIIKKEEEILSIEECLAYSLKVDNDFKTLFKCSSCKNNVSCNIIKEICVYPEIIVIYINYVNQENIKTNFNFNMTLLDDNYVLIGIISSKIYNNEKIYLTYCKDITSKKWFKFEEENLNEIDIDKEKEFIIHPVSLFYQKIK